MSYTERFSEVNYPLAVINPASYDAAAAAYSSYVSLANYHRAAAVFHVGAIAATGTIDLSVVQAKDSSGTGVKAITGKAATQLTDADDNKVVIIELRTEELDIANGFEHVAMKYDVDNAAVIFGAILYGIEPRFAPTPTTNVEEIVD